MDQDFLGTGQALDGGAGWGCRAFSRALAQTSGLALLALDPQHFAQVGGDLVSGNLARAARRWRSASSGCPGDN